MKSDNADLPYLLQQIRPEPVVDLRNRQVISGDRVEEPLLFVEFEHRLERRVVLLHAAVEDLLGIVLPDDQRLAGDVVLHRDLWWLVGPVVDPAAARVEEAAADALLEDRARDVQVRDVRDRQVELVQDLVERLRLADRPGNAVEDEAALVGLGHGALHDLHDRAVIDKLASLDDALHALAERGLRADFGAERVARAEVIELELLDEVLGLGSLAGAWGTEEDDACWFQHESKWSLGTIGATKTGKC